MKRYHENRLMPVRRRKTSFTLALDYLHEWVGMWFRPGKIIQRPWQKIARILVEFTAHVYCSECGHIKRYEPFENVGVILVNTSLKKVIYATPSIVFDKRLTKKANRRGIVWKKGEWNDKGFFFWQDEKNGLL